MHSGFATPEFLQFARVHATTVIDAGILELASTGPFPYLIVTRENQAFPDGANFIISPICLSGAANFDIEKTFSAIHIALPEHQLAGGFLQTRDTNCESNRFYQSDNWHIYIDSKTNYRMPLGLTDEELLVTMKRDSRSRSRKLLRQASEYQTIKVEKGDKSAINVFSTMYNDTAERVNFSEPYRFTQEQFSTLLSSDKWSLYLLKASGTIASGAIVADVNGGFDYTFMAYWPELLDVSRANILFLYKYLSEDNQGYLDLGGGISEGDALARFKLGIGGIETRFNRMRFISKGYSAFSEFDAELEKLLQGRWP